MALLSLYRRRIPVLRRGSVVGDRLAALSASFQSGVVSDYVTWLVVGAACLGGALAFAIR